jgi:hypothetical protein
LYKLWIFYIRHETKLSSLSKVSHCSTLHPVIQREFQTCIQTESKPLCQLFLHLLGQSFGHLGVWLVRQRKRQQATGSNSHSPIWLTGQPNRQQATSSNSHSAVLLTGQPNRQQATGSYSHSAVLLTGQPLRKQAARSHSQSTSQYISPSVIDQSTIQSEFSGTSRQTINQPISQPISGWNNNPFRNLDSKLATQPAKLAKYLFRDSDIQSFICIIIIIIIGVKFRELSYCPSPESAQSPTVCVQDAN